ncbi:DUF4123 domain-containing protein [Rhodovulum sulfidophilum]|uniref:DUF4123 domain-containing protein n=1 Tax=Rhodovulum sulfidophilum TaxID=35806 RepID=UPI001F17D9BA|nr:DUF4123 domain-containing protein [Rhodovulum sulfidophilum]
MLDAGGLCLFEQDAQEMLGDVAPYLVALDHAPELLRRLFTRSDQTTALWGRETAVILRSDAGIVSLRRHLRRFTQIPDMEGKPRFLRFYDPVVMGHILTGLKDDEARLARWFWHRQVQVVREWIVPQERLDRALLATAPQIVPEEGSMPIPPFRIDARYSLIFDGIVTDRLARKISRAVVHSVGNPFDLPPEDWAQLMEAVTALCRRAGMVTPQAIGHVASVAVWRNGLPAPQELPKWVPDAGHPARELAQAKAFHLAQKRSHDAWRNGAVSPHSAGA